MVSHGPGFVYSGADRKKENSGQRPLMEEIQEREESPRPKDFSPAPSSPQLPQTPQTPQPPQTPQRPTQSADSSKGHATSKRFHCKRVFTKHIGSVQVVIR